MKKNDKKSLIMIIVIALLIVILFMVVQGLIKVPKLNSKNNSSELGSITMTAEDYDESQEYEWQYDEIIESDDKVFTNIQNLDLVSDDLTLQAIEDIDSELSNFLMLNGYSGKDAVNLAIIESSIVNDRSYPYFEMSIENDEMVIKAHYDLPNYKWVFAKK
ncbi:hypothetical protein [Butyrivibrio sp. AE2005]|uniref:hypothetical protein n=1 Tax=Butyrivibrio sp. AE2005 TaxID=1496722 RepID=UPI00047D24AC|nr:hypothetical protein [Butyrivibrio sp. AE2005]